jgi:hypothetical protein
MTAPLTFGEIQERAIDDAQTRWHEAIAALDLAQQEAEKLHDARPQLLTDEEFWEALGAFGGMTRMLSDLIEAATQPTPPAAAVARDELTAAARNWDPRLRPYDSIREWTDPRLDPGRAGCACGHCLVSLWAAFMWDLSLLDGLNREPWAEPRHWTDIDESYASYADPEGEALTDMEMRVAAGLDALTGGTR